MLVGVAVAAELPLVRLISVAVRVKVDSSHVPRESDSQVFRPRSYLIMALLPRVIVMSPLSPLSAFLLSSLLLTLDLCSVVNGGSAVHCWPLEAR